MSGQRLLECLECKSRTWFSAAEQGRTPHLRCSGCGSLALYRPKWAKTVTRVPPPPPDPPKIQKTPDEIRLLYLKKRHRIVKLRRKYGVDFKE